MIVLAQTGDLVLAACAAVRHTSDETICDWCGGEHGCVSLAHYVGKQAMRGEDAVLAAMAAISHEQAQGQFVAAETMWCCVGCLVMTVGVWLDMGNAAELAKIVTTGTHTVGLVMRYHPVRRDVVVTRDIVSPAALYAGYRDHL
jgi:hypothetical protein